MYTQKSSTLKIELSKNNTNNGQSANYNQQQAHIEQQQQLFHIMQNTNFMTQQHQSPTHFFASLLQNPAVLANPELMASVAGMLQSSLQQQSAAPQTTPSAANFPSSGNCFRNFSIPNSDSSSTQPNSRADGRSSICTDSDHTGSNHSVSDGRSPSVASSVANSSDTDAVDITSFANSNDLVVNKVMTIIEEILNNENIKRNNFLAKLFEEGTVTSLRPIILVKRVAGFKRIKAVTTEFKIVQSALEQSRMFVLSGDGLSASRVMALPTLNDRSASGEKDTKHPNRSVNSEVTDRTSSKTSSSSSEQKVVKQVLAINFQPEEFNIEKMTNTFEKIGEIAQIILVRPNRKIPEFLNDYTQWVPDLGTKPCAIIDFETQEAAQNACREINMSNRPENELKETSTIRCALLKPGARIKRTLYRKYTSGTTNATQPGPKKSISFTNSDTASRSESTASQDSGMSTNSTSSFNKQFNRKNVKKAISKHFISLGAYKNEKDGQIFLRQPKGPAASGNGFGMTRSIEQLC